jgi:hypothetical protein
MSLAKQFELEVRAQFAQQPLTDGALLTDAELVHLPAPVACYIRRTGAVGRPHVHNFRVTVDATMYRTEDLPLESSAVQYEFVDHPSRYFFLRTRMLGLPVRVLHDYSEGHAHMQVRAAGLVNLLDERGGMLSRAETVTILNDLCIMAPASLIDPRLSWRAIDDRQAHVTFRTGAHEVQATLLFSEEGDLVDFMSDDRHCLPSDGTRWTTPLRSYQDFGGRRIAAEGDALWHYADGRTFRYGTFRIRDIRWNIPAF